MNLKWKGIAAAIIICALAATFFGSSLVSSAPSRPTTNVGPLAIQTGNAHLYAAGTGFSNSTVITTEGYRQITITFWGSTGVVGQPMNCKMFPTAYIDSTSASGGMYSVGHTLGDYLYLDDKQHTFTYQVEGNRLRIQFDQYGTFAVSFMVTWYLTA